MTVGRSSQLVNCICDTAMYNNWLALLGGTCWTNTSNCDQPAASNCGWYIGCLQAKLGCSLDGYPFSYGFKYCTRFMKALDTFTPEGKKWVQGVLLCLQQALVPALNSNATCDQILDIAFASHPHCYTTTQPNICQVGLSNAKALFHVYQFVPDFMSWRAIKQVISVAMTCAEPLITYLPLLPLVIVWWVFSSCHKTCCNKQKSYYECDFF